MSPRESVPGELVGKLPDGTHLAYYVLHEAYYADQPWNRGELPTLMVHAARDDGRGAAWEFAVVDYSSRFHKPTLRVKVFNDAFAAFAQIPDFFEALAAGEVKTLIDVRALLQAMGAVDETRREDPRR